jgi:hypothetical protein
MKNIHTFEEFLNESHLNEIGSRGRSPRDPMDALAAKIFPHVKGQDKYYAQNDRENFLYKLRNLGVEGRLTVAQLVKHPKFHELDEDTQLRLLALNGTGKSPNSKFVKAFTAALKNFSPYRGGREGETLHDNIYLATTLKTALDDNDYPSGYDGIPYKERQELNKEFGYYYELKKLLTKEEIDHLQKLTKKLYTDFVNQWLEDRTINRYVMYELEYKYQKEGTNENRMLKVNWPSELPELFQHIKSRILANDAKGVEWDSFKVISLKSLPAEHSTVVSSSFSTTYYYSGEFEFGGKKFKVDKFVMGSSYYSGGWN